MGERQTKRLFLSLLLSTLQHLPLHPGTVCTAGELSNTVMLCYAMQCRVRNGWKGISSFSLASLWWASFLWGEQELINWTPSIHAPLALVLSSWPSLVATSMSLDPCSLCKLLLCDTQVRQCTLAHSPIVLVRRPNSPKNAANGLDLSDCTVLNPRVIIFSKDQ